MAARLGRGDLASRHYRLLQGEEVDPDLVAGYWFDVTNMDMINYRIAGIADKRVLHDVSIYFV